MRKRGIVAPLIPPVGEGKRGEAGHIGYLLRQAQAAHRVRMDSVLAGTGLTLPQFSVLTMVAAYPGASSADLARLALLTPQTMTIIVGNLERAGAIGRRPHSSHGRVQVIHITDRGRDVLSLCRQLTAPTEEGLLKGLSESEEHTVRRWLVRVAREPGSTADPDAEAEPTSKT